MKKTPSRMPCLDKKGGVFMRNIGFLIVFFAIFAFFSSADTLQYNFTFDNIAAANFTELNEYLDCSWVVVGTDCRTGNCMQQSTAECSGFAYLTNWVLDIENNSYQIKGWTKNVAASSSDGYMGIIQNVNNFIREGTSDNVGYSRNVTNVNNAGVVNNSVQNSYLGGTQTYKWCVINLTAGGSHAYGCYNDSSETGLTYFTNSRPPTATFKWGYFTLHGGRDLRFDDIELWLVTGAPPPTQPSLTLNTNLTANLNTTLNPLKIAYNGTISNLGANTDIGDAYLYLNGTLNQSQLGVNISRTMNFTLNTTGRQEGYNITLRFNNSALNDTVEALNVFIDTVPPQVLITTGFANNSVIFRALDRLNFTLNYSDSNLFAVNFSIYRLKSNTTTLNLTRNETLNNTFATNLTLNQTTTYYINWTGNQSFDPTNYYANWRDGQFEIFAEAWDSHTKKEIKPYKVDEIDNGFKYDDVKIYSSQLKSGGYKKEKDKYSFWFDYTSEGWKDVYLESTGSLFQVENSEYPLHFVDFENGKWVDFSSDDYESYTIEKQSDKKYKLSFKTKQNLKKLSFNSIGDLNYRNSSWYFNISTGFTFYASDSVTGSGINNFTVWVSNSTNSSHLIQNKTSANTGNITFNITEGRFYTNITSPTYASNNTGNLTFNYNSSFTYTLYGLNSLSLLFFDEETNDEINTSFLTVQVINLNNLSYENITGSGFTYITGFSPGNYEIRYGGGGYRVRGYYTTIASDSSQSINLYTVRNTTSSLIVFAVNDEKGQPLSNHTLKAQRYFLDFNSYIVVDMEKTDNNGETGSFLVANTEPYILIVESPTGKVLFRSSPQKIFSSSVFLRITALPSATQSMIAIRDSISTNISYNNNTKILSFFWNDASGLLSEGCLVMTKSTFNSETTETACSTSASATVTINMTPHIANNTRFSAYGTIDTNTTSSEYVTDLITDFIIQRSSYDKFGRFGLFISYLFIATMFMAGVTISFSVALGYTIASLIVIQIAGISFFGWSLIVTITIVGLIIAVVNKI